MSTGDVGEPTFAMEVRFPDGSKETHDVFQRCSVAEVKGAIASNTQVAAGKTFRLMVNDELVPDDGLHFLSTSEHIMEFVAKEKPVPVTVVVGAHMERGVSFSVDSVNREKSKSTVDKMWGFVSKRTSSAMKKVSIASRSRADSGESGYGSKTSGEFDSDYGSDDDGAENLQRIDEDGYINPDDLEAFGSWVFTELNVNDQEAGVFHDRMQRLKENEVEVDPFVEVLPFVTVRDCAPRVDDAKQIVKCHLPSEVFVVQTTTVQIDVNNTASEEIKKIFQTKAQKQDIGEVNPAEFCFKVTGFCEYLHNDKPLRNNNYIQMQMKLKKNLELSVIKMPVAPGGQPSAEEGSSSIWDAENHETEETMNEVDSSWIDTKDVYNRMRVRISAVDRLKVPDDKKMVDDNHMCWVTVGMYLGGELLAPILSSGMMPLRQSVRWYHWKALDIRVHSIPRAARLCITVWGGYNEDDKAALGWANLLLFDHKDQFVTGSQSLRLWPNEEGNPIGTCSENPRTEAPVLYVDVDQYQLPVFFRQFEKMPEPESADNRKSTAKAIDKATMKLIQSDPLVKLSEEAKTKLWACRNDIHVRRQPKALAKVLASCDWSQRDQVMEVYQLLQGWAPFEVHYDALELLDARFADLHVRKHAVNALESLTDVEVKEILLQLTQALKYEPYHNSYLARFLMKRALNNPGLIGHYFFWYLKSELHNPMVKERFGIFVCQYLRHCGAYRKELLKQNSMLRQLDYVAKRIKKKMPKDERKKLLIEELKKVKFPSRWQLPLDSKFQVGGLKLEKCRYMDSKKLPLWLVFENADEQGSTVSVIFKSGDDLRQDMLTLQMIRIMDQFWKDEELDLRMKPYGVISTGDGVGMLEVVLNSETVAEITKDAGGVTAVVRDSKLSEWLRGHNEADDQYNAAVENFMYSCAGYCVATFVLGIGDRHNDNIMLSKAGHLFHIDFGHFLGNFKSKFGIRRERAPFVFTPDFAYLLGGKESARFKEFENICCRAFNILRKHAHLFITLFILMLSTGIPELRTSDDILWLKDMFVLDKTDEEAAAFFKGKIRESLSSKATLIMHGIHIAAHR